MKLFTKINDNTIQCLACNHYCKIQKNQTGICGVRKNTDNELELLVYGKAMGINIDPIEKKPLYHFLPGSEIFSFGTAGCNLRCDFCQNRSMSQAKVFPEIIKQGTPLPPQQIIDYCLENKIPSIAYTYNEPTVFAEYAYDTMKLAKKHRINNIRVSNGFFAPELRIELKPYLNAINIDIKSFSNDFYLKTCGSRIQPVLDNTKRCWENNIRIEVTTLIIPELNDSLEEIENIAKFLYSISPDIPWHLSAFHGEYKMKDHPATSLGILTQAHQIAKKIGLHYVYIGNIHNNGYENTSCPNCNTEIISRSGFSIKINPQFTNGLCPKCKTPIAGKRK